MVNMRNGIMGAVATVIIVMIELILFPVALSFLSIMNSSGIVRNSTGAIIDDGWLSASDRAILANVPTLMIVVVLFTVLGGMIASIFLAVKT